MIGITPQKLHEDTMEACRRRWDSIAHPLHSLGKLEDVIVQIAGITGDEKMHLEKKALIVMCADNGIVEEGVTQTGQEVTAIVAENMAKERSTAAIMCRKTGADIFPVDIGIARDTEGILQKKIAYGTKNFLKEPAMTREETEQALLTGIEMAAMAKVKGYGVLATGEMGIGNTTTASAVVSVLLKADPAVVTGRGAGLSSEGLARKIRVIEEGIRLRQPDPSDGIDVLSKVGGLDIAGMAGVFIGGAMYGIPVVIDGVISAAAALAARTICPESAGFMIASHVSKEPATGMILDALGLSPILHADMCLGEGTGAVALFPLLDLAAAVYHGMTTFGDNDIEEYVPLD